MTKISDYNRLYGKLIPVDDRFKEFVEWMTNEATHKRTTKYVIAGHASWLRSFIRSYLTGQGRSSTDIVLGDSDLGYGSLPNKRIVPTSTRLIEETTGSLWESVWKLDHAGARKDPSHSEFRQRRYLNKCDPPSLQGRP